jgi:hypothetical protein
VIPHLPWWMIGAMYGALALAAALVGRAYERTYYRRPTTHRRRT